VAAASRGNFDAGKQIVRSSASSTQTRRSSVQQRTACGASISSSTVAMKLKITFDQEIAILLNQPPNVVHLGRRESIIESKGNRPQPKLHFEVSARNVNVRWFVRFTTIEMKPVWTDPQDCGHLPHPAVSQFFQQSEIASK
jgi:hypothetical protein